MSFLFLKSPKFSKVGNETALSFPKTSKIGKMGNEKPISFPKITKSLKAQFTQE